MTPPGAIARAEVEAMVRQSLHRFLPDATQGPTAAAVRGVAPAPRLIASISARHCHLDQRGLEALFGTAASLTVLKPLYQEGAFAAEQTVTIFGPRQQMIANLRILGPLREACQVELAFTDARFLGIEAPVRISGNTDGTPGCFLVGPVGGLELESGVIRAARHVHMSPAEAVYYNVAEGDRMRLVVDSDQPGVLDDVIVRIGDQSRLEVHVDTDEGNSLDLVNAIKVTIS